MASDHRGREVHAGKRTAQERGWNEPFTLDHSGLFQVHKPIDPWRGSGHPIGSLSAWRNSGDERAGWRVDKHTETPSTKNIPNMLGTDIGHGKELHRSSLGASIIGSARTPMRAMIAAEAMNKRIEEGRDLKTGRPKK